MAHANKPVIESEIMSNWQLAEELHKPIIKNFERQKVYLPFNDNICCADLANMKY